MPMVEDIMARRKQSKPTVQAVRHPHGATAVHLDGADGSHVVIYDSLRVLITKDDGVWFAQGLEIDYAIDGESLADVKKRFQDGLAMTIESNLRVHESIKPLLRIAPQDVWDQWNEAKNTLRRFKHSQLVFTEKQQQDLPFDGIQWMEPIEDEAA
jgi:hypothetical protein